MVLVIFVNSEYGCLYQLHVHLAVFPWVSSCYVDLHNAIHYKSPVNIMSRVGDDWIY
jgi:hypothetical protein